ncbi:MAG: hypothetical protein ACE5G0_16345 [Rhodothermales bacterium]
MRRILAAQCLRLPILALLLGGLLAGSVRADGRDDGGKKEPPPTAASLRATLLYKTPVPPGQPRAFFGEQRSVPLAFGLSAVVPGLGQAYNGQWTKAAVGAAVEVALIVGYTTWRHRGIDGRDAYQNYAHNYWSPIRYADWLNEYTDYLETRFGTPIAASAIHVTDQLRGIDFSNPSAWTMEEQLAVRTLINQIRAIEGAVYHPETGASFSHKLPFFGEQQYYELVGKYFQFAPGWSDYEFRVDENGKATWVDENGDFIASVDPEMTASDGSKPNVSPRFFEYARDHGRANDYLRRASRVSIFFIANHLIAAVDAAIFAKVHNDRIKARLLMNYDASGQAQPGASIQVSF